MTCLIVFIVAYVVLLSGTSSKKPSRALAALSCTQGGRAMQALPHRQGVLQDELREDQRG